MWFPQVYVPAHAAEPSVASALPQCSLFEQDAQDLALLFMVGMAVLLALCEQAGASRAPDVIADRLRRVAASAGERAQRLLQHLPARRLSSGERQKLFPMFAQLCARAGLNPEPEILLYRDASPNAFALGDRRSSAVLVSEGLLGRLDAREMTAVLAHEIAHILNGDAGLLSLAAELDQLIREAVAALASRRSGTDAPPPSLPLLLALVAGAPLVSTVLQHGLSRAREYDADRVAAGLMGHPFWLVGALHTLHAASAHAHHATVSASTVSTLLRSHPAAHERIGRLVMRRG